MSDAFVCDATGKTEKGKGVKSFLLDLPNGNALLVTPQRKVREKRYAQGEICAAAAERVRAAVAGEFEKKPKKKGEK